MLSITHRCVLTSGDFRCGTATPPRLGTSLFPVTPPDSLWLARAHKPALRSPGGQRSQCHVPSRQPRAPVRHACKPAGSAQALAWSALARLGDLVSHRPPQHCDGRERRSRAAQQLVGGSRNVIRGYNEWTFKGSRSSRTCCGLPLSTCKLDRSTPAPVLNAVQPLCNPLFRYVPQRHDGPMRQFRAVRLLSSVPRACVIRSLTSSVCTRQASLP